MSYNNRYEVEVDDFDHVFDQDVELMAELLARSADDFSLHNPEDFTANVVSPSNPRDTCSTGHEFSVTTFMDRVEPTRNHTCTPAVDLRSLDYVSTPNENLVCPICTSPLVKPIVLDCEHTFCEDCLYDHLSSGIQSANLCPKCRNEIDSIKPVPKLLHHLLDELEVHCPNELAGCGSQLKRYTMTDHVNTYCNYAEINCPSLQCLKPIQRRFLDGNRCRHSQVECCYCQESMMEVNMEDHFDSNCPKSLLLCDHCQAPLRRSDIKAHYGQDCLKIPTSCDGSMIGCTLLDSRDVVNEHMKKCPFAVMAPHIQQQNERQTELQRESTQFRKQMMDLDIRLEELENNFKALSTSIKKDRRRSLATETTVSANRIEEITARVDELATDYNSRFDNVTSENARMHLVFHNESINTSRQFHQMNATLTALRTHLTHLSASRTAGGNSGSTGTTSANSAGSGVTLDSRREPPKL